MSLTNAQRQARFTAKRASEWTRRGEALARIAELVAGKTGPVAVEIRALAEAGLK